MKKISFEQLKQYVFEGAPPPPPPPPAAAPAPGGDDGAAAPMGTVASVITGGVPDYKTVGDGAPVFGNKDFIVPPGAQDEDDKPKKKKKEVKESAATLTQVSFDEVEKHFDEIQKWNDRINLLQLTKNKDSGFDWWAMVDGDEWVAVAGIDKTGKEDAIYLNEVMAKSGGGYGVKMIRDLFDKYKSSGKSKFYFDAETNGGLADYYKKKFPDFEIGESPWNTPEFTKWYKKPEEQQLAAENTKITLTIGQLKRLIRES